jgi:hypothetical protein
VALAAAFTLLVLLFLLTRALWGALRRAATWMRGA